MRSGTLAKEFMKDRVSVFTLKELLGHSSIVMCERYTHLSDKHKKAGIKKLELSLASAIDLPNASPNITPTGN